MRKEYDGAVAMKVTGNMPAKIEELARDPRALEDAEAGFRYVSGHTRIKDPAVNLAYVMGAGDGNVISVNILHDRRVDQGIFAGPRSSHVDLTITGNQTREQQDYLLRHFGEFFEGNSANTKVAFTTAEE